MTKFDTMMLSAIAGGFDRIVRTIPVEGVARP